MGTEIRATKILRVMLVLHSFVLRVRVVIRLPLLSEHIIHLTRFKLQLVVWITDFDTVSYYKSM